VAASAVSCEECVLGGEADGDAGAPLSPAAWGSDEHPANTIAVTAVSKPAQARIRRTAPV